MSRYLSLIEQALQGYMAPDKGAPLLQQSMAYSLLAGGKRVRPCMCLAVCDMLGGQVEEALPLACALEMIHTYSLIHDDLPAMDNDVMRRGKPSSHVAFGEANAILAGDGLLTLAGCVLLSTPGDLAAKREIFEGAMDMARGQSLDLNQPTENRETLEQLHDFKTGALFRAAVLAGARAAGVSERELPKWRKFARDMGLLFQITDDILDEEKDKQEHKLTYVSLLGREGALAEAKKYCDSACACLNGYDNAGAEYLRTLAQKMVTRQA